jgi:integrase
MATFQLRKNGKVTAKIRRHGITKSETFSKREDAEAWARKVESEIERGLWRDTTEAERTTIADICKDYRNKVLPALHGKGNSSALNVIEERLGNVMLAKLTPRLVADFRDWRLKTVSNETVRKELGVLSKMIDTAQREWGITIAVNPCKGVTKPAPGRPRDRRLLPGEQEQLEIALSQCRNNYMLPLFKIALETAARQGELLALRWKHVNKNRKLAMLYDTKNGEDRATPLSSAALAILDGLPRALEEERVFPLSQSLVVQAWGHAIDRARRNYEQAELKVGTKPDDIANSPMFRNLHFHDLRHEALSRLAERGDLSVLELASVSGHKTLQMLKRYTHLQAEKLAEKLG